MIKYLDLQKINASFEPELSDALLRVSIPDGICTGKLQPVLKRSSLLIAVLLIALAPEMVWMLLL